MYLHVCISKHSHYGIPPPRLNIWRAILHGCLQYILGYISNNYQQRNITRISVDIILVDDDCHDNKITQSLHIYCINWIHNWIFCQSKNLEPALIHLYQTQNYKWITPYIWLCMSLYLWYYNIVVIVCFFLVSIMLFLYSPTWAHHWHLQEYFSETLRYSLYNIFRMPAPSTSIQIRYCVLVEVIISLTVYTLQFIRWFLYTGIGMFFHQVAWPQLQLYINLLTCLTKNTKTLNLIVRSVIKHHILFISYPGWSTNDSLLSSAMARKSDVLGSDATVIILNYCCQEKWQKGITKMKNNYNFL